MQYSGVLVAIITTMTGCNIDWNKKLLNPEIKWNRYD